MLRGLFIEVRARRSFSDMAHSQPNYLDLNTRRFRRYAEKPARVTVYPRRSV